MAETDRPATPRDSRQSAKGALTRQRIIDAAAQLLCREGGVEVSIADIARVAGMSKGSVYYYFSDSDEIVSQVLYNEIDRMLTSFEQAALSSVSAHEALVGITRAYVEGLESNVALTRFAMGELHGAHGLLSGLPDGKALIARLFSLISTQLERGKLEGAVRPEVDSDVVAPSILGAFWGASTLVGGHGREGFDAERLIDALLAFIGSGVSVQGAPTSS